MWFRGRGVVFVLSGQNRRVRLDASQRLHTRHQIHPEHRPELRPHRLQAGYTEPPRTIQNHTEPPRTPQNHTEPPRTTQNHTNNKALVTASLNVLFLQPAAVCHTEVITVNEVTKTRCGKKTFSLTEIK